MGIYKETIRKYMVGHQMRQVVSNSGVLDLAQFYLDATAMGATQDKVLFEAELSALPSLAKNEAETILVPGIYKNGKVYGFNGATKSLVEFDFSRASSGTYFDKNGIMQTAVPGMPRIDFDPVTKACKGYLVEAASINMISWSNNFNNWQKASATINDPSANTSYGKPFGRLLNGSTATAAGIFLPSGSSAANTTYCFRITLRAGTSNRATVGIGGGVDATGNSWGNTTDIARIVSGPGTMGFNIGSLCTFSGLSTTVDTIVEVTRSYTNAGVVIHPYVFPNRYNESVQGDTVLISCAQLEPQLKGTSYIETIGAAGVRALDTLSSASDIVVNPDGGVYFNFGHLVNGQSPIDTRYIISKSNTGRFAYNTAVANTIMAYNGSSAVAEGTVNIFTTPSLKSITAFGNGSFQITINTKSSNKEPHTGLFGGSGTLSINHQSSLSSIHAKALAIFSRVITEAEQISITT